MKKILVVEDENNLRFFLKTALNQASFEVQEAIDAEEALEKVKKEKPDLILLDIILPGKSGFDFMVEIKKYPEFESIPIIIVSNLGQREEIERALELGARDYIVKANFTLDEIVKKVKEILK